MAIHTEEKALALLLPSIYSKQTSVPKQLFKANMSSEGPDNMNIILRFTVIPLHNGYHTTQEIKQHSKWVNDSLPTIHS